MVLALLKAGKTVAAAPPIIVDFTNERLFMLRVIWIANVMICF
jgi:hypothetical protein